jgi:hypothetical protein
MHLVPANTILRGFLDSELGDVMPKPMHAGDDLPKPPTNVVETFLCEGGFLRYEDTCHHDCAFCHGWA